MSVSASWTRLSLQDIPSHLAARSSHCLGLVDGIAYIFGGEKKARTPIGDEVLIIDTHSQTSSVLQKHDCAADWPQARVGAAFANDRRSSIYMWGGRAGKEMAPIPVCSSENEDGEGIWRFDTKGRTWSKIQGKANHSAYPASRSYHTMAYADSNIYVHAGCPSSGRLASLHAFNVNSHAWKQLRDAPGQARGGTALAALRGGRLARWGGFCGHELGGPLDIFDSKTESWTSEELADEPVKRSVHGFVPYASSTPAEVTLNDEKCEICAVMFMGEGTGAPKELGHDGAGKFLRDVYLLLNSKPKGAFRWHKLNIAAPNGEPQARGWFAYDVEAAQDDDQGVRIVLHGGLNEENERLADAWILDISLRQRENDNPM